jgi:hypothetical protein
MAKLDLQVEPKIIFQSEMNQRALRKAQGSWKVFGVLARVNEAIARVKLDGGSGGLVAKTPGSVDALWNLPLQTFCIRHGYAEKAGQN